MMDRFAYLRCATNSGWICTLRDAVSPILANNILHHFTDHSVDHSDAMVEIVNKLIEPIQSEADRRLTDDELSVLYAACYLHDIGMQYENAGYTQAILKLKLGQPWEDLAEETRRDMLRRHHHLVSAEMVHASVRSGTPLIGITLKAEDHANEIACLCEGHALDTETDRYRDLTRPVGKIRMNLISAVLRLADILEESRRRAAREKGRTLILNLESQTHWWRHYYTEDVVINPKEKIIEVYFDFPATKYADYGAVVPELQLPLIKDEILRHENILNGWGLHYTLKSEIQRKIYSDAEEMPANVLEAMRRQLWLRNEKELEAKRELALRETSQLCKSLILQIDSLAESGDKSVFDNQKFEEITELLQELRRAGGSRSAWKLLASYYHNHAAAMEADARINTGILLVTMMANDNSSREAAQVLTDIAGLARNIENNDPRKCEFFCLFARVLANACHTGTEQAYQEAIALCLQKRKDLKIELAEYNFLQTQLNSALENLNEPDPASVAGQLSPRSHLLTFRAQAMLQGLQSIRTKFDGFANDLDCRPDKIALLMLKAELFFLDGATAKAMEVFKSEIDPLLGDEWSLLFLTVADNRNTVAAHLFEQNYSREFHALVDERRRWDVDLWGNNEIAVADDAFRDGKHYEALPAYWNVFMRAYRSGYWRSYWWAAARMSRECLALELHDEAAFHAMVAQEDKLAKEISEDLLRKRNRKWISATLSKLVANANLARHATVAATIFGHLGDAIPDNQLSEIVHWLLKWAARSDLTPPLSSTPERVWRALLQIAHRFSSSEADAVIGLATSTADWKSKAVLRRDMIRVVSACVSSGSAAIVATLVDESIGLISSRKCDFDYVESLDLICEVYQHVDKASQVRIQNSLFPTNSHPISPMLVRVAQVLGKELGTVEDWSSAAESVADSVRLQVQRLENGQKPAVYPGSYGTFTAFAKPNEPQVVVQIDSGSYLLALTTKKTLLSLDAVDKLVDAILAMILERENSVNNKLLLVRVLTEIADVLSPETQRKVNSALLPIAAGRSLAPTVGMSYEEAQNPLNPFKMSSGNPKELCGAAIIAIATIDADLDSDDAADFELVLNDALTNEDGGMRLYGLAAIGKLRKVPQNLIPAILMGTRDPDGRAASEAINVLVSRPALLLDDSGWKILLFSIRLALNSDNTTLRRAAAAAVNILFCRDEASDFRPDLMLLKKLASDDICWSVRAKVGGQDSSLPF